MKRKDIQYYVEGEDEIKLINTLKKDLRVILPGKVHKLNVLTHTISDARLLALPPQAIVVLVFDTDTSDVETLNANIRKLSNCPAISKVITIPQVKKLEHELIRSCDIKQIKDLLGSKSNSEFKSDMIHVTNLQKKLIEHKFDIGEFWAKTPAAPYQNIENLANYIKLKK